MLEETKTDIASKKTSGVLVILVVLVVLGGGLFYVINSGLVKNPAPVSPESGNGTTANVTPTPQLVIVDFAYKVKSITAETIVLVGKNGDFLLPNDAVNVKAYRGLTKESPAMPLSSLKVGDNINMEFVPGKSVTLFVSAM